ncbi:cytochrome b [uncultured Erythrobacter sp.]|uniref:cytochrome b n=1 Tax=uncultured Erythrobacter sp. TaxID=263913 RepID=UPI002657DFFD|nr:cytochrome b [uncultured Erythrobacter sp.]
MAERTMMTSRYNLPARLLHWIVAVLVLAQFFLGFAADQADGRAAEALVDRHVQLGLLILSLMLVRLLWRSIKSPTCPPQEDPRWQRWLAKVVHHLIYALIIIIPVSGYVLWAWMGQPLDWFGIYSIPILFEGGDDETWRSVAGYTHYFAGFGLIALVAVHVCAALWHQFVKRDGLITDRMM